ncbi:hypothetical protein MP228_007090 [Amoeboaphelidium protococcarum]|nr:hypothetical protein MP228_007090 [Amoeboaphelidium protococcarum]
MIYQGSNYGLFLMTLNILRTMIVQSLACLCSIKVKALARQFSANTLTGRSNVRCWRLILSILKWLYIGFVLCCIVQLIVAAIALGCWVAEREGLRKVSKKASEKVLAYWLSRFDDGEIARKISMMGDDEDNLIYLEVLLMDNVCLDVVNQEASVSMSLGGLRSNALQRRFELLSSDHCKKSMVVRLQVLIMTQMSN